MDPVLHYDARRMQSAGPRDTALDSARALAVVAMVMGHTLDALLDTSLRETPAVATYWRFREFTAPLFFLVSGWAVATVVDRSTRTGLALVQARLPRVLLLLALGYLLRLPIWGWDRLLAGDREVWAHLLAFDALHCIGVSLFLGTVVVALVPGRIGRVVALGGSSVAIALLAAPVWNALSGGPLALQQMLGGGTGSFPLLPWGSYFFAGAAFGTACARLEPSRRTLVFFVAGLVASIPGLLSAVTLDLTVVDRRMYLYRLGPILIAAASLSLVPSWIAHRIAPIGRASLAVYVLHLPVLYGWGTWGGLYKTIGATLPVGQTVLLGISLLSGSVGLALAWGRARSLIERRGAAVEPEASRG